MPQKQFIFVDQRMQNKKFIVNSVEKFLIDFLAFMDCKFEQELFKYLSDLPDMEN
jgi:hypothetical protein